MAYFNDPVQDVVAQSLESMAPNTAIPGGEAHGIPVGAMGTAQPRGIMPATTPSSFNLYAGQGAGGFGQGSTGTQSFGKNRTTAVF